MSNDDDVLYSNERLSPKSCNSHLKDYYEAIRSDVNCKRLSDYTFQNATILTSSIDPGDVFPEYIHVGPKSFTRKCTQSPVFNTEIRTLGNRLEKIVQPEYEEVIELGEPYLSDVRTFFTTKSGVSCFAQYEKLLVCGWLTNRRVIYSLLIPRRHIVYPLKTMGQVTKTSIGQQVISKSEKVTLQ